MHFLSVLPDRASRPSATVRVASLYRICGRVAYLRIAFPHRITKVWWKVCEFWKDFSVRTLPPVSLFGDNLALNAANKWMNEVHNQNCFWKLRTFHHQLRSPAHSSLLTADEDGYFGLTPRRVIDSQGDELRMVHSESVDLVSSRLWWKYVGRTKFGYIGFIVVCLFVCVEFCFIIKWKVCSHIVGVDSLWMCWWDF